MVGAKTKIERYESYKDSGIEWLGEIPAHWEIESFKHILTERNEKNAPIKTKEILSLSIDKGVTLYAEKTTNLDRFKDDFSKYKLAHKGDLVFNSMNMIVGAVGVSDYFGCVSPVYYTYHGGLNNSYTTKFYEYLFRSKIVQGVLYSLGKGLMAIDRGDGKYNTLRLKVSRDDLRSMKLPFPNPSEQTQIVQFLNDKTTKIDEAIAIKQQQIQLLKERKQILIHKAVTQGLNPNVTLKNSGVEWIGEIPEHWEVTAVKYVLEIPITDGPHTTPELLDEGFPFISAEAIKKGEIDFNKKRGFISEKDHKLFSLKYLPMRNDIYMVKSGATTGNIAMVKTDEEFSIWSPLAVFRSNLKRILPQYLYIYLESSSFKKGVELSWSFGTQQNIGMGVLSNLPISFPSIEEQKEISTYIETTSQKIETATNLKHQEIAKLKEYKSSLINSVVTGKVKVC
ncbi:MAG: restriction endonuclease subunit S [Flavobacteriaceae bacterium]|nr:restriction endonuclease subunit S [Flavobacteriaceae bacterium]